MLILESHYFSDCRLD